MLKLESSDSAKCRNKKGAKTFLRLAGYIRYRLGRSKLPWMHLKLEDFAKLTGKSLITCKRALSKLRDDDSNHLVFRTVNENRRWKILVADTRTLQGAEPLPETKCGKRRIIKSHKNSKTHIKVEQLRIGSNKLFWKDDAPQQEELHEEQQYEDPNQTTFCFDDPKAPFAQRVQDGVKMNLPRQELIEIAQSWANFLGIKAKSVSIKNERRILLNKGKTKFSNKHWKNQALDSSSVRKLAFHLQRDYRKHWYDNLKIEYDPRYIHTYIFGALMDGHSRQKIESAFRESLLQMHGVATDVGEKFCLSSTIANARKSLQHEPA